jgi:uncharacterized protein Yka (UPF0111/DUF47 family)
MSNEKGDHESDQTVNGNEETHLEGAVQEEKELSANARSQIQSVKAERSQETSNVTRLITRLTKLIHDRGGRTQIREIVRKIESQVKGADSYNRKLYTLVSDNEFESVEKWFIEVAEKADDAIAKALTHLEEREDDPPPPPPLSWGR